MKNRQIQSEPIVPMKDGRPPDWIVICLTCGWKHDAHGSSDLEALDSVSGQHQETHRLTAEMVNYSTHPLYGGHDAVSDVR